jgi:hypothetical protein
MRSLRLIEIAAEAEALRLRRQVCVYGRSAAFYAVAALFGIATLVLLHAAAFMAIAEAKGPMAATLWLAAFDAIAMLALFLIGRRRPDPIAAEALTMRRQAVAELRRTSLFGEALTLLRWRRPVAAMGSVVAEGVARAIARR